MNAVVEQTAAQLHAESLPESCFSSHWGIDGLKPYMRYSLAGGYQRNGENGNGVYSLMVRGNIDGGRAVISEYSIFHGITRPETYTPR